MGIRPDEPLKLRPVAHHTSGLLNFEGIRHRAALISTRCLLKATEHRGLLTGVRSASTPVRVDGKTVLIRDQRPIRVGSVRLEPGSTLQDFADSSAETALPG